jgi:PIF1-like helicase
LDKDPFKKILLQRTDVFFFEEIGLLSAEYFTALDTVLKIIMNNSLPCGGKLFICCGDSKQLPPIDGRPIWTSANICTMMKLIMFKSDVRAEDPNLRWINGQCRLDLCSTECAAVANAILDNCSSAVDWDAVPEDAVRIVPTKAAERDVIDKQRRSRVIFKLLMKYSMALFGRRQITRSPNG